MTIEHNEIDKNDGGNTQTRLPRKRDIDVLPHETGDLSFFPHETERLAALADYQILDTEPEAAFDRLTRLAAQVFTVPIALISLIDETRQWFKSRVGIEVCETPREDAFCNHAVRKREIVVVCDAALDPRFANNPLVTGSPFIRFYAGAPLITIEGYALGTLCILDRAPRPVMSYRDQMMLKDFARIAMSELDLRQSVALTAKARQAADQANRVKSKFLAMISHEIRTPMNGILGTAQLLKQTRLEPQQQNYVETLFQSGKSLNRLIGDILDMTKIEAGHLEFIADDFSLQSLVERVRKLIQPLADTKNIKFDIKVAFPPDLVISSDEHRLHQVLLNLIDNAIKFTDQGSVIFEIIGNLHDDRPRATVFFAITDTGIGIDEATQAQIFAEFVQADATISRRFGGSGLGLAIAQRIIKALGGEITVTSEPGKGSRFSFFLELPCGKPLLDTNDASKSTSLEVSQNFASDAVDINSQGLRILIGEDSPINQMVLHDMLKNAGHTADVVASGEELLRLWATQSYDAILLDTELIDIDGLEVARRIRTNEDMQVNGGRHHIPIIAVTGHAFDTDRIACLKAGMDEHLAKPIEYAKLIATLKRHCPPIRPTNAKTLAAVEKAENLPIFDRAPFEQLKNCVSEDRFHEIFHQLQASIEEIDDVLRLSARTGYETDWPKFERSIHTLAGAAGTLGFRRLSGEALIMQEILRRGERPTRKAQSRVLQIIESTLLALHNEARPAAALQS